MSAQPVDVLAVMKSLAGLAFVSGADEGPEGNEPAYRLHQDSIKAIDAVAELVEAANEVMPCTFCDDDKTGAWGRLEAALARVQGGAA